MFGTVFIKLPWTKKNIGQEFKWKPVIVFRMEFGKTRWSCPLNSDQTVHKTLPGGGGGRGWGV